MQHWTNWGRNEKIFRGMERKVHLAASSALTDCVYDDSRSSCLTRRGFFFRWNCFALSHSFLCAMELDTKLCEAFFCWFFFFPFSLDSVLGKCGRMDFPHTSGRSAREREEFLRAMRGKCTAKQRGKLTLIRRRWERGRKTFPTFPFSLFPSSLPSNNIYT